MQGGRSAALQHDRKALKTCHFSAKIPANTKNFAPVSETAKLHKSNIFAPFAAHIQTRPFIIEPSAPAPPLAALPLVAV
ncbi:MAG: hypothetical protein ACJA06_002270 [Halocynthiibacter sp.]